MEAGEAAAKEFLERFTKSGCAPQPPSAALVETPKVHATRWRTKTLPRLFTERSWLKRVHATLTRAGVMAAGIRITPLEYQPLLLLLQERKIAPAGKLKAVA